MGELLADHTTIRLGGPAGSFVRADSESELVELVSAADAAGRPVLVLGGGSNLVVADAGFGGLVVQVAHRGYRVVPVSDGGPPSNGGPSSNGTVRVRVAAGEPWDDAVQAALADGLAGLENLSGIPGLAGATPIQNVGAYGAEISELVDGVRVFDRRRRETRLLSAADCAFGYRTSALKGHDRYLVLSVDLLLCRGDESRPLRYRELASALGVPLGSSAPAARVRSAVLALRAGKGMLIDPVHRDPDSVSAGSFFTNPVLDASRLPAGAPSWPAAEGVKTSAAWLIEQAGFGRGFGRGAVGLSTKHSLALVNRGGATTAELLDLAGTIRDGVGTRFGVTLETEPALVGVSL